MRSLLFVPGDSERKLEKGLGSEADALIIDLEDSVSLERKEVARQTAREFLSSAPANAPRLFMRINEIGSGLLDDDLVAIMPGRPAGIMLPKCAGAADVENLSTRLRVHEAQNDVADGATLILPIITETAAATLNTSSYRPGLARLAAVTWGAEDLAADIGASANRDDEGRYTDTFRLARALTLLAASAAQVPAIDTIFADFRDDRGFHLDCVAGVRDGFAGRMAIHPAQVPIINEVFTPASEEVERARQVVDAFASAGDPGVVAIGGKMYDRPHLRQAERLLARAAASKLT